MVKYGQVGLDSGRMYSEGTAEQVLFLLPSFTLQNNQILTHAFLYSLSQSAISRACVSTPKYIRSPPVITSLRN